MRFALRTLAVPHNRRNNTRLIVLPCHAIVASAGAAAAAATAMVATIPEDARVCAGLQPLRL